MPGVGSGGLTAGAENPKILDTLNPRSQKRAGVLMHHSYGFWTVTDVYAFGGCKSIMVGGSLRLLPTDLNCAVFHLAAGAAADPALP